MNHTSQIRSAKKKNSPFTSHYSPLTIDIHESYLPHSEA